MYSFGCCYCPVSWVVTGVCNGLTRSFRIALLRTLIRYAQWGLKDLHNKNHLLLELAVVVVLWTDLPVEMQQLLQLLVPRWHNELYNRHHERWLQYVNSSLLRETDEKAHLGVSIDSRHDDLAQRVDFDLVRALLQSLAQLGRRWHLCARLEDDGVA